MGDVNEKNRARLRISWELLRELLDLPEDTRFVGAAVETESIGRDELTIVVEQPGLKPVAFGAVVPIVCPVFQIRRSAQIFQGWQQ